MLESNFHSNTVIYVDNADMAETQDFLKTVRSDTKYKIESQFSGKVVLIKIK